MSHSFPMSGEMHGVFALGEARVAGRALEMIALGVMTHTDRMASVRRAKRRLEAAVTAVEFYAEWLETQAPPVAVAKAVTPTSETATRTRRKKGGRR